jgi:DNA polymerase-4
VSGRLRHAGIKAGTVTVKGRDSGFHTVTRQRGLPEPSDLTEPIWRTALDLARPEMKGKRIRLLGVAASGFGVREQLGLFEAGEERQRRVVEAADEVRERFGTRAITRARLLRTGIPAPFERDLGTAVERRGEHAEDPDEGAARRRKRRDSQADTTPPEDAFDE